MKRIFRYYKKYWLLILLGLVALVGEALCELELPGYMADVITYGIAVNNMSEVLKYGLKMLLITLASAACGITVGYFSSKTAAFVCRDIRKDLYKKVMSFSAEEYNKFNISSLITRSTNDITQIQNVTMMFLRMIMFAPVMGIGGVVKAWEYSSGISELTWLIVGALGVILAMIMVLLFTVIPKFSVIQKQVDRVNLVSNEELSGMLVVRAFNNQQYEENRFDKSNRDLTKSNLMVNRVAALLNPFMGLVMYGMSLGVVIIASNYSDNVQVVANVMAFVQYGSMIIMAFMMISMLFIMVPRAMVSAKRVAEILNTEVTIVNSENAQEEKHLRFNGEVEFKDVSYSYGGENAIEDISFKAYPGKTLAIIGSTGSGKSTIVNLIPRLADPTKGEVSIDGKNIKEYNLKDLRENIGFVPQKNILFSGTIESNIKYSNSDLPDEKMKLAANIAQAESFIEAKEDKYQDVIAQGGSNVSGGQKQRLAIARAIAKNAPIYVFDDSFSALDFKTDSVLRKSIKENLENSTIIIVAQRVGTIMNADEILVLDDGKIVGRGKHKELLKNCPVYFDIASSQLSKEDLLK